MVTFDLKYVRLMGFWALVIVWGSTVQGRRVLKLQSLDPLFFSSLFVSADLARVRVLGFAFALGLLSTHRLRSSSFLGLPSRIQNMNHKTELLWSPRVNRPQRSSALRAFALPESQGLKASESYNRTLSKPDPLNPQP